MHGVDRLPGDAENAARAMDEIVADSDEDGGDTDEDVPDQPEDDYESDGDDQEWALGFCERAPAETLQRQFFPSKVGGRPAWLDPVDVPTAAQLKCLYTREPLDFLLQVYASVDDEPTAFHRAVFLFVSPHGGDLHRPGAVRAFRSQLPRINPFYPDEPCEPGDPLQELTDAQHAAYELRHDRWSDDAPPRRHRAQAEDVSGARAGRGARRIWMTTTSPRIAGAENVARRGGDDPGRGGAATSGRSR